MCLVWCLAKPKRTVSACDSFFPSMHAFPQPRRTAHKREKCLYNQRMRYILFSSANGSHFTLHFIRKRSHSDRCVLLHFFPLFALILSHCRETPFYLLRIAQCNFLKCIYLCDGLSCCSGCGSQACACARASILTTWPSTHENVNGFRVELRCVLSWIVGKMHVAAAVSGNGCSWQRNLFSESFCVNSKKWSFLSASSYFLCHVNF